MQDGRRYGHILDPRTGWPARRVYSASAVAPTATEADALSTAFYVMGFEATRQYCREHREVGAVMVVPGPSENSPPRVRITGAVAAEVMV
jgi:thiamine biosynthesis lipoprotein